MTTEIKVTRKEDKVILKTKGVTVTQMEAEEALKFAHDVIFQADKILAATKNAKK